jgi:hypothetical protein
MFYVHGLYRTFQGSLNNFSKVSKFLRTVMLHISGFVYSTLRRHANIAETYYCQQ